MSSGAIALGRTVLGLPSGPLRLEESQAAAAVGQIALARNWAEALGEPAGIHESFFEIGGSSLLATRILARIYDAFGVDLPLRAIFTTPTIAGLAGLVETVEARGPGAKVQGARLARIDREGTLPLAPDMRPSVISATLNPRS